MGVAFVAAILQVAGAAGKPAVLPSVGTARLTDVAAIPVLVDSSEMRLTYAAGLVVSISCVRFPVDGLASHVLKYV